MIDRPEPMEWTQSTYTVTTNSKALQLEMIHGFLTQSYWAQGISKSVVEQALKHSLNFGLFAGNEQIGFARMITDYTTFGYLADVFVLEAHRGKGLAKWLLSCIKSHPELQSLRRWSLVTADGHGLYEKFGFHPLAYPDRFMEIHNPNIYKTS